VDFCLDLSTEQYGKTITLKGHGNNPTWRQDLSGVQDGSEWVERMMGWKRRPWSCGDESECDESFDALRTRVPLILSCRILSKQVTFDIGMSYSCVTDGELDLEVQHHQY